MNLIQFAITSWFVFVVAAAFAHQYWKRKVNNKAALHIGTEFKTLGEGIARVEKYLGIHAMNVRLSEPKEATRVYAMLIQRGFDTRLIVQPANSFEEMSAIVLRELGPGWMTLMSSYADALNLKLAQPTAPEQAAPVEKPIANFIHDLEYCRDAFADAPTEKKAVDAIISKIREKHYGRSSTAA